MENNLELSLIQSLINVESSYNPNAVSRVGAIGLMQLMPSTASFVASQNNINYYEGYLYKPEYNIKLGCLYFRYLLNKFNEVDTAIIAYNAGETVVRSWLKDENYSQDGKVVSNIPYRETKSYLKKVKFNIKIYSML